MRRNTGKMLPTLNSKNTTKNYVTEKDYNPTKFLLDKIQLSLSFNDKRYNNWQEKSNAAKEKYMKMFVV